MSSIKLYLIKVKLNIHFRQFVTANIRLHQITISRFTLLMPQDSDFYPNPITLNRFIP